jgi:hypothetical protein
VVLSVVVDFEFNAVGMRIAIIIKIASVTPAAIAIV